MLVMQELWMHVLRFEHGHSRKWPKLAVHRACANRGINLSYSFADAMSDDVTPETQITVADHAQ